MNAITRRLRSAIASGEITWVKSRGACLVVLSLLLLIMNGISLGTGAAPVGWPDIWQWLIREISPGDIQVDQSLAVIGMIRLPRILLANLAGAFQKSTS